MNDLEAIHAELEAQPGTTVTTPFGPEALVYKVAGKMFAYLVPEDVPVLLTLKCDPDRALDLRDAYPSIQPGYHMNKNHWISLRLDGSLPDALVLDLVRHAHACVVTRLPRRARERLDTAPTRRTRSSPFE